MGGTRRLGTPHPLRAACMATGYEDEDHCARGAAAERGANRWTWMNMRTTSSTPAQSMQSRVPLSTIKPKLWSTGSSAAQRAMSTVRHASCGARAAYLACIAAMQSALQSTLRIFCQPFCKFASSEQPSLGTSGRLEVHAACGVGATSRCLPARGSSSGRRCRTPR